MLEMAVLRHDRPVKVARHPLRRVITRPRPKPEVNGTYIQYQLEACHVSLNQAAACLSDRALYDWVGCGLKSGPGGPDAFSVLAV